MTTKQGKLGTIDVKALLAEDEEFLRVLVRTALQEVLEAEMSEALGAEKGERTAGRLGYRSGHDGRTLITRIGKLELRVPQDRAGRFSTELNDLKPLAPVTGGKVLTPRAFRPGEGRRNRSPRTRRVYSGTPSIRNLFHPRLTTLRCSNDDHHRLVSGLRQARRRHAVFRY